MALTQRLRLVCVILDAYQQPATFDGNTLVFPYSQRDRAERIASALTEREAQARQAREREALADCKPGALPGLASSQSFSVALVKVPMDDEALS